MHTCGNLYIENASLSRNAKSCKTVGSLNLHFALNNQYDLGSMLETYSSRGCVCRMVGVLDFYGDV